MSKRIFALSKTTAVLAAIMARTAVEPEVIIDGTEVIIDGTEVIIDGTEEEPMQYENLPSNFFDEIDHQRSKQKKADREKTEFYYGMNRKERRAQMAADRKRK